MSGHVRFCPAVQPEPFPDAANLIAVKQLRYGPPETLAQGVFRGLRLFCPSILIEAITPSIPAGNYNAVRKAGRARWWALAVFRHFP